jgi:PKD repeat protein
MELPNQAPHSVRAIKIIDTSVAAAPPSVTTQGPATAELGKTANFTATYAPEGVPVVQYHWDFGDGTSANGAEVRHTYTRAGIFSIQLEAEGADGIAARKTIPITISGVIRAQHEFKNRRRYAEPGDR